MHRNVVIRSKRCIILTYVYFPFEIATKQTDVMCAFQA